MKFLRPAVRLLAVRTFAVCSVALTVVPTTRAAETTPLPPEPNPVLQLPAPPTDAIRSTSTRSELATQIEQLKAELPQTSEIEIAPDIIPLDPPAPVLKPQNTPQISTDRESLQTIARRLKLPLPLPKGRIVIWKAQRKLELWNGTTLVKRYRVNLGPNPVGHKQRQGDGRTPEGTFRICTRNDKTSAFHIFLGLDYPNVPDAARGLKNKQITAREYQIIRNRLASRGAPLWQTNLGGWVGIHGGSDANYARRMVNQRGHSDWTAGCIALTNREIEELHRATKMGTEVSVKP